MPAGRPARARAGTLYAFAHQLYWDFRQLEEGRQRTWFDGRAYELREQAIDHEALDPTERQDACIHEVLDDAVQSGHVKQTQRSEWLTQARDSQRSINRMFLLMGAAEDATRTKRVPGEPDVLDALLAADTPARVRHICQDASVTAMREVEPGVSRPVQVPNWPLPYGSMLPLYLSQYADAFIAAKKDGRFPKSTRPSSRLRQLWFLSRAMAGAVYGVTARTAINLVGSTRPEETFEASRAAKPARRTTTPVNPRRKPKSGGTRR